MSINTINTFTIRPSFEQQRSIENMPNDVLFGVIYPLLKFSDLAALNKVSKTLNSRIQPILWDHFLKEITFGKEKWLKIPGVEDIGEEPPIPQQLLDQLRTGELFPRLKVKLILIPETINGEPHNFHHFGKIMRFLREGNHETVYRSVSIPDDAPVLNLSAPKSHWILMPTDVIPETRSKTAKEQETLIKTNNVRFLTLIETVTAIGLLNFGKRKEDPYFFGQNPWTCTRTSDSYEGIKIYVGAASSSGFDVYYYDGALGFIGAAACAEVLENIGH